MDRTERQKIGIRRWIDNNGNGILAWSTGVGKTYGSIMLLKALVDRNPMLSVLISVPTEVLKEQWIKELAKHQLFSVCKVEIINTIIKTSWQVDLLIIDEIHKVVSEEFIKIFERVQYKYFLGLTGTLKRLDGKEVLLDKYTKVVDEISLEEAVQNNWLSNYRNYKVLIEVDLTEYNLINQKFNSLFSFFNYDFKLAMDCVSSPIKAAIYAKKMGYKANQVRGFASAWMRLLRKRKQFVMSHPKKFEIARAILEARKTHKCITFSASIKDSESFGFGYVLHSKRKKADNKKTIEDFCKALSGVLHTSKAVDEGADIKGLSTGIILSGDSSSIRFKQRVGRTIRFEEGKIAEVFTLVIKNTVEEYWFNNAAANTSYITINESQLKTVLAGGNIVARDKTGIVCKEYRF